LCFVGSHLAARQHETDNRNANYRDIVKSVKVGRKGADLLNQFDHVFWCGDLNYRIDIERDKVMELIQQKNYPALLEKDQLNTQRKLGNVFNGFAEGQITFAPTYRYNRGDRTYSDEVYKFK
jgi:phosphatidylinositol-bisphosphatase